MLELCWAETALWQIVLPASNWKNSEMIVGTNRRIWRLVGHLQMQSVEIIWLQEKHPASQYQRLKSLAVLFGRQRIKFDLLILL